MDASRKDFIHPWKSKIKPGVGGGVGVHFRGHPISSAPPVKTIQYKSEKHYFYPSCVTSIWGPSIFTRPAPFSAYCSFSCSNYFILFIYDISSLFHYFISFHISPFFTLIFSHSRHWRTYFPKVCRARKLPPFVGTGTGPFGHVLRRRWRCWPFWSSTGREEWSQCLKGLSSEI